MNSKKYHATDVIILQTETGRQAIQRRFLKGPFIGIWWDDLAQIVAILQQPNDLLRGSQLVDSDFSHSEEWPEIAHHFGKTADDEYFTVPRGRVLLNWGTGNGLIYHGNGTGPNRLRAIADLFKITAWEARIDEHYLLGDAAVFLFDNNGI